MGFQLLLNAGAFFRNCCLAGINASVGDQLLARELRHEQVADRVQAPLALCEQPSKNPAEAGYVVDWSGPISWPPSGPDKQRQDAVCVLQQQCSARTFGRDRSVSWWFLEASSGPRSMA